MPKEFNRSERMAEIVRRELAVLIQQEVKDPRLKMVTVSAVKVSRDLSYAKVYITVFGDDDTIKENVAILNKAAGFLRSSLANRIKARIIPALKFIYDASIIEGDRLQNLIDKAVADDDKNAK